MTVQNIVLVPSMCSPQPPSSFCTQVIILGNVRGIYIFHQNCLRHVYLPDDCRDIAESLSDVQMSTQYSALQSHAMLQSEKIVDVNQKGNK